MIDLVALPEPLFTDRMARTARKWSNRELRMLAPLFPGDVVNVSAWEDEDKEGGRYEQYFANASSYHVTNVGGQRGASNHPNEHFLDLMQDVPAELRRRFDVAFNHTTLEHIFEVRRAFRNICELSRDVVIVVVPFSQLQHETASYGDYWRFTPTCLRELFSENGFEVIYEVESDLRRAAIYLLAVGVRSPSKWREAMPPNQPIKEAGSWIGYSRKNEFYAKVKGKVTRLVGPTSESW